MTKQRLISLWEASKAANGPWNSRWIDEMILKGVILFTSKWINLDATSAAAKRFQAALTTDLEIDFDRQGQIAGPAQERSNQPQQAALPPPADKLSSLEDEIMGKTKVREKVSVDPAREPPSQTTAPGTQETDATHRASVSKPTATAGAGEQVRKTAADGDAVAQAGGLAATQPPAASDPSFTDRATAALTIDNGVGHRWFKVLEKATAECPSMGDLSALHLLPSVVSALKNAPPQVRSDIAKLFKDAAFRLGNVGDEDAASDGADAGWSEPKAGEAA